MLTMVELPLPPQADFDIRQFGKSKDRQHRAWAGHERLEIVGRVRPFPEGGQEAG